jgi:tetratricopeptide (TPR) repeat protein
MTTADGVEKSFSECYASVVSILEDAIMKKRYGCLILFGLIVFAGCVDKEKAINRRVEILEEEASLAIQTQNYALAEKKFSAILDLKPDIEHINNNLAVLYAEYLNQPDKAVAIWEELLKEKPSNAAYYNNIAGIHWRSGELDKAIDNYQKAAQFHRSYHMPYYNMAQIYMEKHDWESAEKMAATGYNLAAGDLRMNIIYIKSLLLNGKRDQSKSLIQKAIERMPAGMQLELMLARILVGDGDYAEAETIIDKMLAQNPQNELYLAEKVELLAARGAETEEIEKIFMQIDAMKPSQLQPWLRQLYQARTEYAASNLENAKGILVDLERSIPVTFQYFEGLRLQLMASVLRDQQKVEEAENLWNKAFYLAPERVLPFSENSLHNNGEA